MYTRRKVMDRKIHLCKEKLCYTQNHKIEIGKCPENAIIKILMNSVNKRLTIWETSTIILSNNGDSMMQFIMITAGDKIGRKYNFAKDDFFQLYLVLVLE